MPIWEYRCRDCGRVSEFLVGVTKVEEVLSCKGCGSKELEKLFPSSFGVISSKDSILEESGCCGMVSPCDNPKRCSGR